jgi:hypothetical protein
VSHSPDVHTINRHDQPKWPMNDGLSATAIVDDLARETCSRVARKTRSALQQMKHALSGEDSGLTTTWDEICVQVQIEYSALWDVYDETIRALVMAFVDDLAPHERAAIWLQTDAGFDWSFDDPESREDDPIVGDGDLVDYIVREYVLSDAGRWSNPRIRSYIDRFC